MSDPIVTPDDLGTYLNDSRINEDRAQMMIDDTLVLATPFFLPGVVPAQAAAVVRRVAGRGYVTTTQSRTPQLDASGSPFAGGFGGVWLTRQDRDDLTDIAVTVYGSPGSGSRAFTINMLPAAYSNTLPPWDIDTDVEDFAS